MPSQHQREITLRGILLGIFITIIFTTANVYLGLKVGLTFASSIPAAVFAMAFFRFLGKSNILENNIVQTQVSAAGTLSAIVFIIPALFFIGYWNHFYFWQTFLICACGGILGVIFTIPFRIELVEKNKLPYPEGIAAAEVLQLGEEKSSSGMKDMLFGISLSSIFIFLSQGLRLISDGFGLFFNLGKAIFQIPFGFSLALIGAGWLVGLGVGCAILIGVFLAWGILVPILSTQYPDIINLANLSLSMLESLGMRVWEEQVRFIGVGMIGISAIWTLLTMLKPTFNGLKHSLSIKIQTPSDIPLKWLICIFAIVICFILGVFYHFFSNSNLSSLQSWTFILAMTFCSVFVGFLISATCGYMAGLVGSSSSPISGIGILGIVLLSLITLGMTKILSIPITSENSQFFIALTIFSTSIIFAIATIANDNLQDLKAGMLLKATPWKQEVVLMIGCIIGAIVIAPVLNLLYEAYGFIGHLPREGMNASNALNAPQAILMSSIAQGIFKNTLNWLFINIGIVLGCFFIVLDCLLQKKHISLPPLAIGMGVYLPPIVTLPIFVGALLAYFARKKIVASQLETFKRRGTLLASGLIVGESLMGIILAGIIVISIENGGSEEILSFFNLSILSTKILGFLSFCLCLYLIYHRLTKPIRNP